MCPPWPDINGVDWFKCYWGCLRMIWTPIPVSLNKPSFGSWLNTAFHWHGPAPKCSWGWRDRVSSLQRDEVLRPHVASRGPCPVQPYRGATCLLLQVTSPRKPAWRGCKSCLTTGTPPALRAPPHHAFLLGHQSFSSCISWTLATISMTPNSQLHREVLAHLYFATSFSACWTSCNKHINLGHFDLENNCYYYYLSLNYSY